MNTREQILAGNYQLLDSLIQNRDEWKSRAETLERLLNRISSFTDKMGDSPNSFLTNMQQFSESWKKDREFILRENSLTRPILSL